MRYRRTDGKQISRIEASRSHWLPIQRGKPCFHGWRFLLRERYARITISLTLCKKNLCRRNIRKLAVPLSRRTWFVWIRLFPLWWAPDFLSPGSRWIYLLLLPLRSCNIAYRFSWRIGNPLRSGTGRSCFHPANGRTTWSPSGLFDKRSNPPRPLIWRFWGSLSSPFYRRRNRLPRCSSASCPLSSSILSGNLPWTFRVFAWQPDNPRKRRTRTYRPEKKWRSLALGPHTNKR